MKYVLDSHMHTLVSGHAYHTITEMAKAGADKGLELIGITEHAPKMPGSCHQIYFQNLRILQRKMEGIEVLFGVELNILDTQGHVDMPQELLERMDVVIASAHTICFAPGSREENTESYLNVMKNPAVDIIGHPDDPRYPLDLEALVQGAAEYQKVIEINNSSLHPLSARAGARPAQIQLLKLCETYQVPVIFDSDAHCSADVGNHQYTDELLKSHPFPEALILNTSVDFYKTRVNRFKKK